MCAIKNLYKQKVVISILLLLSMIAQNNTMCICSKKIEALEKFIFYKNEVENQFNKKIKVIRSDRGGEYEAPIGEFCAQHRIIHEVTTPYSRQSNGVAERKNRTLKEMITVMLISSGLPQNMWGEAILSSNYLLNKVS